MAVPVVLPKLGNTVESSIIVRWYKSRGETVKEGESLCEVETDKATVDVESPASGVLLDMFFQEGDNVTVMTPIAAIGVAGENADSLRPNLSDNRPTSTKMLPLTSEPVHEPPQESVDSAPAISPRARKRALENEVNIRNLSGSGPEGRIIERDVMSALKPAPRLTPLARSMVETGDFVAPEHGSGIHGRITVKDLQPALPSSPVQDNDETITIPLRGVRQLIAERMLASLQSTAQLTMNASADARALLDYRKQLKASSEAMGLQGVTINHLVLFVVTRTLLDFPALNSLFLGDRIVQYRNVHLGFAVDTPRGLIVPVVRSANHLSLKSLADQADELAKACQQGTITPDHLQGGTFAVSNLGSFGIESFTPVLNPPQVGILGVGSINLKPVAVNGEVQFIPHLGLSLTINHQAVDGAPAARFMQALVQNMTRLNLLLAL
jgi:pyruvate dehydrogenase E2 component (dihydrolipoamide acetyltransferase)